MFKLEMVKGNKDKPSKKEVDLPVEPQELPPSEPKFLSETPLYFRDSWKEVPVASVPPQTPTPDFDFDFAFETLPKKLPTLENLEVPLVREKGVKMCMSILGEYFGINNYKFSLLQFWFLDMVIDCLWRVQDEFGFPVKLQKTILGWVLYIFDLIRDPSKNFSRKKLFKVFKESMMVAAEVVGEGCSEVPLPEDILELIDEDREALSAASSSTSRSSSSLMGEESDCVSYLRFHLGKEPKYYALKKERYNCNLYDMSSISTMTETSNTSSAKPSSDKETINPEGVTSAEGELEGEFHEKEEILEDVTFYQPDPNIPARFLPLPEEESVKSENDVERQSATEEDEEECAGEQPEEESGESSHSGCTVGSVVEEESQKGEYDIYEIPGEFELVSDSEYSTIYQETCSSNIFESVQESETKLKVSRTAEDIKNNKEEIHVKTKKEIEEEKNLENELGKRAVKHLARYKLWEQRMKDMADPRKGWIGNDIAEIEPEEEVIEPIKGGSDISNESEWLDIIEDRREEIRNSNETEYINFGVLWAIMDFIFDYFEGNFQFTLIKLAFQGTPNLITQNVNYQWNTPKIIKDQLLKPPKGIPKKETKEKSKKDDSSKIKSKQEKTSTKDKDKKGKDKNGKDKKGKDKKSKIDKPSKKPKPLTKEEKVELEILKREQELLEQEQRLMAENKMFMFPLREAATVELFTEIFENWKAVDFTKVDAKKGEVRGKKK